MTYLCLVLAIVVPWLLGFVVLALLFREKRMDIPLTVALGFGLGFGIFAQWMLFLGIIGVPFQTIIVGLPVTVAIVGCLGLFVYLRGKSSGPVVAFPIFRLDPLIIGMIIYLAACGAYIYWRAFAFPVYAWDAVATVSIKAKIFFYDKSFEDLPRYNHPLYPLHIPLIQSWIAMMLGKWDGHLVKIIFPVTATCYAVIQYSFVRLFSRPRWALFSVVLLTMSPLFMHHATIGYRDLTLCYFNCSTVILAFWWFKTKQMHFLVLAALFSGLTTFVKLEGTGYLACHSALILGMVLLSKEIKWTDKVRVQSLFSGISIGIWSVYTVYKYARGLESGGFRFRTVFGDQTLDRVPAIIESFADNLFASGNWSIIWLLFALSLLRFKRIWRDKLLGLLIMTCLMFIGFYFLVALLTPNFVYLAGGQASKGLARVFLHFYGLAPIAVVLINAHTEPRVDNMVNRAHN